MDPNDIIEADSPPPEVAVDEHAAPVEQFDDDDTGSASGSDPEDEVPDMVMNDRQSQEQLEQGSTTSRMSMLSKIGGSLTSAIKVGFAGFVRPFTSRRNLVEPGFNKTYDVDSKTFNMLIGMPEVMITNIVMQTPAKKIKAKRDLNKLQKSARYEKKFWRKIRIRNACWKVSSREWRSKWLHKRKL